LHPKHHEALNQAGFSPKYVPTLQEVLALNAGKRTEKRRKWRETDKEIDPSIFASGTLNYGKNLS
jgi:hypothetical protein